MTPRRMVLPIVVAAWSIVPAGGAEGPASRPAAAEADRLVKAYLAGRWAEVAEARRSLAGRMQLLTARRRDDVAYVRKALAEHRPAWWASCKAKKKGMIRVGYWGRTFSVTYAPGDKAGLRWRQEGASVVCSVHWDPNGMDSPARGGGSLGGRGFSKGVVCELGIWRVLVSAYTLSRVAPWELEALFDVKGPDGRLRKADPAKKLRFQQHQSFASELAALYHVGPVARQASLVWCLAPYKLNNTAPLRPRRAIAAMVVATFLQDLSKWPSLKLPDRISDGTEKSTAMFYHFRLRDPWTLAEDRALREAVWAFHRENPDKQVLGQGKIVLPNGQTFLLDIEKDKPHEARRNAWVRQQLEKARPAR